MKHNIKQTSPFATKQLGDKLNKIYRKIEKIDKLNKIIMKKKKEKEEEEDLTLTQWLLLIVIVTGVVVYIISALYALVLS